MVKRGGKVVIVGGGIAGLCAAVYARKCGYDTDVFEMNDVAGGLATSWHRGGYTFETCLHWLLGSRAGGQLHAQWAEVFDIDKLAFIYPEEFACVEDERGDCLHIYSNLDRLEAELLEHAEEDATEIRRMMAAVRHLTKFEVPDPSAGASNWKAYLHDLPLVPLLRELSSIASFEYGKRFKNWRLRSFFGGGDLSQISAITVFLSLAWMSQNNAGYPIGGSQAVIQAIAQNLEKLGGKVHLGAKVERVVVENGRAKGIQLVSGERIQSDWVVSAADGHATLYEMLGGEFIDTETARIYETYRTFPSYVQVSLGVAQDLSRRPGFLIHIPGQSFRVDPGCTLSQLSFRFFHFDPTFAAAGKTAVTCFLPTRSFEYWLSLQQKDPAMYTQEKERISRQVINVLEQMIPGVEKSIEVTDVSTPATVIRHTGNWKGSMEGWLLTPQTGFGQLPNKVHGLERFMMVGQWVMPGGGLPAGLMTARAAVKSMCREDRVQFLPEAHLAAAVAARPGSASTAAR